MSGRHLNFWIMCILLEGKILAMVNSHTTQPKVPPDMEGLLQVSVGERALLTCQLPHPTPSLDDIRVYWQEDQTDQVVHVFNKGQEEFVHQDPAYSNRTRLFTNQLWAGNFSLELNTISGNENYTTFKCILCKKNKCEILTKITLWTVESRDNGNPPDKAEDDKTILTAVTSVVVVGIAILSALVYYMRKCQKKGFSSPKTLLPGRIRYFSQAQRGPANNDQGQEQSGPADSDHELEQSGPAERPKQQQHQNGPADHHNEQESLFRTRPKEEED